MSTESLSSKNPLQREGTSQSRRLPSALDPLYAKLDDRDLYDYLDFVYKYSEIISFIPSEGLNAGKKEDDLNWQLFFSCGIILLSHISKNSSVESNRILKADLNDLEESNFKDEIPGILKNLQSYFDKLETWKLKFPKDDPFKEVLQSISSEKNFTDLKLALSDKIENAASLSELIENTLSINSEIIRYFDGLVQEAEKELQSRLRSEKFNPHIALLLAFLKLFEKSRDQLNDMTERHLNFYYEDILQIKKKAYREDEAHILIQLAKNIEEHELKEGTLFKGPKDSQGNELLYALTENFIAGNDSVSQVRSTFDDGGLLRAAVNSMTLNGIDEPLAEDNPVWSPFKNSSYPAARLGFAVSSPVLRLKSGVRKITFSFDFESTEKLKDLTINDFMVEYSSSSKWIQTKISSLSTVDKTLKLQIDLAATAEAVTNYSSINMEDEEGFDSAWPIFKFTLTESAQKKKAGFIENKLNSWEVSVDVSEIKEAVIQNDTGLQKIEKPFFPFGPQPVVGSQLYIGHPEIFSKKVTSLSLNWNWVDAPASIANHYSSYSTTSPVFQAVPSVLYKKAWQAKSAQSLNGANFISKLELDLSNESAFSNEIEFKSFSNDLHEGFIRLKLSSPNMAFGHKEYPKLHQKAVIEAGRIRGANLELLEDLKAPYTPVWENMTLSYKSATSSKNNSDKALMKLFTLEEFGHMDTSKYLVNGFDGKGHLFIGLDSVEENSSVSLLLQFAEGTADPFSTASSEYDWYYLDSKGWQKFAPEHISKDTTEDLLQSGIVRFTIGSVPATHSLMPDKLVWLKLVVRNDPALFNDFISIQTQATSVRFQNNENTLEHLQTSAAAGSIKKLKIKDPAVKSISQPFNTFGGSPEEDKSSYTVRVSERLRHKDRAVQIWDYERLVLENFPEIYKVKCLNHTGRLCTEPGETTIKYSELSPGDVTLICIPDLTNSARHNYFRPAVKFATLKKVKTFLEERCSKWVNLEVGNPKYEELNVSFNVKFYKEITNTGFYLSKLKEDIDNFLTPWANDLGRLTLGNRIYKSTILNFVEEREYVDFLTDFDARLTVDGEEKTFEEEIIPTSSLSLIVPGNNHNVNLIK